MTMVSSTYLPVMFSVNFFSASL